MPVEWLLLGWSGAGLAWWLISVWLVVTAPRLTSSPSPARGRKSLTVFKPLPPLEGRGLQIEARGLESFISQLDETSELLLGVHEDDAATVLPFVERMRASYPHARVIVVRRSEPDSLANPKIAWQKLLVPRATGELWLWSDADIVAPPGFLQRARMEFEAAGTELLTFPYAIRTLPHRPAILDALFVNTEFYPGVLLLQKGGTVDFGLGAGMLFSRESFLRKANWDDLGASLADDFVLGQTLKPVRLSRFTLETVADATGWRAAVSHYFRWKKTVCWCRPGGFAAQILIMPLLGWIIWALVNPMNPDAWLGLLIMMQLDVVFAAWICHWIGCRLSFSTLLAVEAWSLLRVLFWLRCWLPGRVKWRNQSWRCARQAP